MGAEKRSWGKEPDPRIHMPFCRQYRTGQIADNE